MLCARCQTDNKPGQHSCWYCLSPLDGTLAQRFAQKPPDVAASSASVGPKKQSQGFWLLMGLLCFLLVTGSMVFFWYVSDSAKKDLPEGALAQLEASKTPAAPAADTSGATADASTAGASTAGASTAGASTAGASTSGAASSSSDATGAAAGKSDSAGGSATSMKTMLKNEGG